MSSTPVTATAWVLHDLGLANLVGGNLFGKLALQPAARRIEDEHGEQVLESAWNRYKFVNFASIAAVTATWFTGRALRSGREVGRHGRMTVLAKDVLVAAMAATGIATGILGMLLGRARRKRPEKVPVLERTVNILGDVTIALAAGVQATTCLLALQGSRSATWTLSSRRLP